MTLRVLALAIAIGATWTGAQGIDGDVFAAASVKTSAPLPPEGALVRAGSSQPGGRWMAQNARFMDIVRSAYPEHPLRGQIVGGPAWVNSARFDINATAGGDVSPERMLAMVRNLLHDRFKLRVHQETRQLDALALVVARADGRLGPDLRPSSVDCAEARVARTNGRLPSPDADERPVCAVRVTDADGVFHLRAGAVTIEALVPMFQGSVASPIVDRTGLAGRYDADMDWAADSRLQATAGTPGEPAPSLFDALSQGLGLKLETRKESIAVLVIDSAERPEPD